LPRYFITGFGRNALCGRRRFGNGDAVLIRFQMPPDGQRWSIWEADRGKRRRVRGGAGWAHNARLPHDLAGYAVERTLGLEHGFWHCIADGATFKSTDRKRTKPGRAVIASRRAELQAHDALTHTHWERWERGEPTPAAVALDDVWTQWAHLAPGEWMTVVWDLPQRYAHQQRHRRAGRLR
jgi:hypothetical protein